jgi:hypothetical protein
VSLNNTYIELNPGVTSTITANVKNPVGSDQNNVTWTSSDTSKVKIVTNPATGRVIQIQGVAVGDALITATVPSSGRIAVCNVSVVHPKQLTLSSNTLTMFPGDSQKIVTYTVSPVTDTVTFTSDMNTVTFSAASGKLYIDPTNNQGTTVITGKTSSGASASLTVMNSFNNYFALSKSSIRATPDDTASGLWTVDYEVSPANAELRIYGLNNGAAWENVQVTPGSIVSNSYVLIPASNHNSNVDSTTGITSGSFTFQVNGEFSNNVIVSAVNTKYRNAAGVESTQVVAERKIDLQIMYWSYSYTITEVSAGINSKYDTTTQTFVIGDGENIVFDVDIVEQKANQNFLVDFNARDPLGKATEIPGDSVKYIFTIHKIQDGKRVTLTASPDYKSSPPNDNVLRLFLAGEVVIRYPRTGNKPDFTYTYPVYLEIRGN